MKTISAVIKFLSDTWTVINVIYVYKNCYKRCDYTVDELCRLACCENIKTKFITAHLLFRAP